MPRIKEKKLIANDYRRLIKRLERQTNIIAILKSVDCCTKPPLKLRLSELEKLYGQHETHMLCDALNVDRGTFLNHIKRNKRDNAWFVKIREEMTIKIRDFFEEYNQIFGSEKIAAILRELEEEVSDWFVSVLMSEMGLKSLRTTSKKEYTTYKRRNILRQHFTVDNPNVVCASDVTFFKYNNQAYYICVVPDLFSRMLVSYKISKHNSTHLTKSTLLKAIKARNPKSDLIFHSDNGSNYNSKHLSVLYRITE